jgi:hypothetical protein
MAPTALRVVTEPVVVSTVGVEIVPKNAPESVVGKTRQESKALPAA